MKIIITIGFLFSFLIGRAQTSDDRKSTNSNERFVATPPQSISVTAGLAATLHNVMTITNPIGSGCNIHIDHFKFFTSGPNLMIPTSATIFINPTPVTANYANKFNGKIGSNITDNTTIVGYNLSTAPLNGTLFSPYEIPQVSGEKFGDDGFLEIMEGQSIGIDLSKSVGLGVAMSSGILMVYYHKIPN